MIFKKKIKKYLINELKPKSHGKTKLSGMMVILNNLEKIINTEYMLSESSLAMVDNDRRHRVKRSLQAITLEVSGKTKNATVTGQDQIVEEKHTHNCRRPTSILYRFE